MNVKKALVSSLLVVGLLVTCLAESSLAQANSNPLISTAQYWEARLSSVQYAEIAKPENARAHIVLKGDTPSSALALVVTCTALQDMQFGKEYWTVSAVPKVKPARGSMSNDVSIEVIKPLTSGASFAEMMVLQLISGSTSVYLSNLTAKKGETLTVLFAFELPQELRNAPGALSPITIHADKIPEDIRVPVPWRTPAMEP